jgi:tetratricopeptide (TPR) repeat protein
LFLIALLYLGLRALYFGGIGDLEGRNQTLSVEVYALTQGLMILKYALMTFAPLGFTIDHRPLPQDFPFYLELGAWVLVAGLTIMSLKARHASSLRRLFALGWILFLLALLPISSIVPTVDLFVERRAYLADFGLFMAVAGGCWWLYREKATWRKAIIALVGLAVLGQGALAIERARTYGSLETLWQESLSLDPENPRAMINLAVHYSATQRWEESRKMLEALVKIQPMNGSLYSKLAYIYTQKNYAGRNDDLAWTYFQKSFSLNPDNIFALFNAGVLMMDKHRYAEAEDFFIRATHYNPQMAKAFFAAGEAAFAQNKKAQCREYLQTALRLNPQMEEARRLMLQVQ